MANLYAGIPSQVSEELTQVLLSTQGVRIERIVSLGHSSPPDFWYHQDEDEWVLVLMGAARISFEDEELELMSGDYLHIRAHRKHRVEWTTPTDATIWLAVFHNQ